MPLVKEEEACSQDHVIVEESQAEASWWWCEVDGARHGQPDCARRDELLQS